MLSRVLACFIPLLLWWLSDKDDNYPVMSQHPGVRWCVYHLHKVSTFTAQTQHSRRPGIRSTSPLCASCGPRGPAVEGVRYNDGVERRRVLCGVTGLCVGSVVTASPSSAGRGCYLEIFSIYHSSHPCARGCPRLGGFHQLVFAVTPMCAGRPECGRPRLASAGRRAWHQPGCQC